MSDVPDSHRAQLLRVLLATPYGQNGMGGIDRLNDAIVDGFERHPDFSIHCARLVTRGKGSLLSAQPVFAAALLRFAAAAARREVDLLHIHLSVRGSSYRKAVLAKLARALGVPYVIHLHGTDYKEFWYATNDLLRAELGRMFAGSERLIVLGEFWAGVMRELDPALGHKLQILPNATAAVAAKPSAGRSDGTVHIAFLGQLGQRKGSADLLQALKRLQHLPSWTAVLAGDGAIAETKRLVAELGLDGRVSVPGWISTERRTALLAASDMLVLPSYAENLPMVILEAFAQGLPVISTPVGAIPEVLQPEHNGLLVPPGDVPGLAAAISRLVEQPGLRARMGQAARRDHAEKYDMDGYLKRLAAIWSEAVTMVPTFEDMHAHPSEIR